MLLAGLADQSYPAGSSPVSRWSVPGRGRWAVGKRAGRPGGSSRPVDLALGWRESTARATFRLLSGRVLAYVATDAPAFALTFDDGPDPQITPALLDVL